jgi:hypothetical protein
MRTYENEYILFLQYYHYLSRVIIFINSIEKNTFLYIV